MENRFDRPVTSRAILVIGLLLGVLFITGFGLSCQSPAPAAAPPIPGQGLPGKPAPVVPSTVEVTIEGFAYKPATLNIPVGTTVTWHNNDTAPHTVTARDNSFDSGSLANGGTFSHTFQEKGTFEYYCKIHPNMAGKVTVE
jgi:plastocyanin